ncbi:GTPase [Halorhodospira abdelmalekii]|uniref:GTPase n=1 Tax=Halorhodospira abdelmalekii TaxID=421629 RepID=UPI00190643D9|nr:GTPase [Halorhodospira abdelmalekii]
MVSPTHRLPELADLETLAVLGEGRLETAHLEQLHALLERAEQRLARSQAHTVIALAGGTGSGKSSLLNALLGETCSKPGVRRPTTDHAVAVVIGDEQSVETAQPLLDWLQVFDRHALPAAGLRADLEGAIFLDLPDIDSLVTAHWESADRLIDRCDLLLWVFDPLKYAHAVAHRDYFVQLAHHAEILLVALNHADQLAVADQQTCQAHLQQLLTEHGLGAAQLRLTSAADGLGIAPLRDALAREVASRQAPLQRLTADITSVREQIAATLPAAEDLFLDEEAVVSAARQAVGLHDLLASAAERYQQLGQTAVRSPTLRLLGRGLQRTWQRLWPGRSAQQHSATAAAADGLGSSQGDQQTRGAGAQRSAQAPAAGASGSARRAHVQSGAAPAAPRVAEAPLQWGLSEAIDATAQRLPGPAAQRLRRVARQSADPLARALRRSLAELPITPRPRGWWRGLSALRALAEGAALLGLGWLIARSIGEWLVLPPLPVPMVAGELGWPPVLLFGGITLSMVLGWAARPGLRRGGRRHQLRIERELKVQLQRASAEGLLLLQEELEQCQRLARQVEHSR